MKHTAMRCSSRIVFWATAAIVLLDVFSQSRAGVDTTLSAPAQCKLCGQKYPDAKTLLRNSCPNGQGGKHIVFAGSYAEKYICENCGKTYMSLRDLTRNKCSHENGARHVPYAVGIRAQYACRWCGIKYKSLKEMTRNLCSKHPDGRGTHRPGGQ